MPTLFNVYCDESCHLPFDHQSAMALGAVWCPQSDATRLSKTVMELKVAHGARGELKWNKVSPAHAAFYKAVIDWFFAERAAHFRGLVVEHKERLDHSRFNQNDADLFYYKMQFSLVNKILSPDSRYAIYLDVKDTQSRKRVAKLRDVLCNNAYDFTGSLVERAQNIHSHESALMQLCDFFTGALGYLHRGLNTSATKRELIELLELRAGRSLMQSSPLREDKFNVFVFTPQAV